MPKPTQSFISVCNYELKFIWKNSVRNVDALQRKMYFFCSLRSLVTLGVWFAETLYEWYLLSGNLIIYEWVGLSYAVYEGVRIQEKLSSFVDIFSFSIWFC